MVMGLVYSHSLADSPLPKPSGPTVQDSGPVYRCFHVGAYAAAEQFSGSEGTKVTLEQVPKLVREMLGDTGTFIDLSSHIIKEQKPVGSQTEQWLFFHLESQTLHGMLHLSKHRALAETFQLPRGDESLGSQLQLSIHVFSVNRPSLALSHWNAESVAAAGFEQLFQLQSLTSSGEVQKVNHKSNDGEVEVDFAYELYISDDLIDVQVQFTMDTTINGAKESATSMVSLRTGKDFYAPIGVSVDKERMKVVRLRVDVLNAQGKIVEPWK